MDFDENDMETRFVIEQAILKKLQESYKEKQRKLDFCQLSHFSDESNDILIKKEVIGNFSSYINK